jgi:hydroxymethylbilane synthase
MNKALRLGTRGSPLALIQAEDVRAKIFAANPHLANEIAIEIVPIRTSGDWREDQKQRMFLETGDKGLFTKELEEALMAGSIDMAVHSMKDVPSKLPDGLIIPALLERADPRDAFISNEASRLEDLSQGASVGTSSLRRQAQILARRPDLKVVPLRGNVDTRLKKLQNGEVAATILALAGMKRLGLSRHATSILDPEVMLPSAGQGAIGIEIRADDDAARNLLSTIHSFATGVCVGAERAFLLAIDGSCTTPIGALAQMGADGSLKLDVLAAKPDGTSVIRMNRKGSAQDAIAVGDALGREMKDKLPSDFFALPT